MKIVTAFISDRADLYLPDCMASYFEYAHDSELIQEWRVFDDRFHERGLAGNTRDAWEWALSVADADFLFHIEEDFRFTAPVDLSGMAAILDQQRYLAQVVLKRQPWSPEEQRAGGIMELHPRDYRPYHVIEGHFLPRPVQYVEHERIFSLNPCLIPRRTLHMGWPDGNEAEMTHRCIEAGKRFAFYGSREDPPRVLHVGYQRGAGWKL